MLEIPDGAREIISTLRQRGFITLLAGGGVRDYLLGVPPKDFDLATSATPAQIADIFPDALAIGAAFGVMTIARDRKNYEIATFRADGEYRDGRHPENVVFASAREDAFRRDFTINALFYDPNRDEIIDYVGGREDLRKKIIRAVGVPSRRFAEDRLRLLRAIRFAARLDFAIDAATAAALKNTPFAGVSAERTAQELNQIFTSTGADRGLKMLADFALLPTVLPEVAAMIGVAQPPEFHPEGDVFQHVVLMLKIFHRGNFPEFPADHFAQLALAWAIVLHDVAKPAVKEFTDRWRFNRHEQIGAEMSEKILTRLKQPTKLIALVGDLVVRHMHFIHLQKMREAKRRRWLQAPFFPLHLALHYCDCAGSHGVLDGYAYAKKALDDERRRPPLPPRLLTGNDLLQLGFKPGAIFKTILTATQDAFLEGEIVNLSDAKIWVKNHFPLPQSAAETRQTAQ